MNFFKIPKNIFSRDFYEMITVGLFGSFYIIFLIAIYSGVISITQDPFPKYILLFSFPLFLIFLYLSKIFPQERIGNCLHIIIFGLIIAAANTYWGGNIRINGPLLSAYILLMPIYALLLDPFLPWFIASIVSIGLILEFILAGSISFLSGIEFFCKILVFFVIAFSSSTLIKKILLEQKNERRIKKAYQIEKKNREQAEKLASQEKILREQAEDLAEGLKQLNEAKSVFINTAAHDLRTPLTELSWGLSGIERGIYGDFQKEYPEKAQDIIVKLQKSTERLNEIVESLLSVARIQQQTLSYKKEPINSKILSKRL